MTRCPKCHYEVGVEDFFPADACPKCGAIYAKASTQPKRRSVEHFPMAKIAAVGVLFLVGVGGLIYAKTAMRGTPTVISSKAPAVNTATVINSPLDGSVKQVEQYLKTHLKDPSSLDVIRWYPVTQDLQGYAVRVTYRARNSLGGMVVEDRVFLLDRAGNVTP